MKERLVTLKAKHITDNAKIGMTSEPALGIENTKFPALLLNEPS